MVRLTAPVGVVNTAAENNSARDSNAAWLDDYDSIREETRRAAAEQQRAHAARREERKQAGDIGPLRKPLTGGMAIIRKLSREIRGLTIAQKMVAVVLADHADEDGICWPSQKTVAAAAGCTEREVRRSITALKEAGILANAERRKPGGGLVYEFAAALLECAPDITHEAVRTPSPEVRTPSPEVRKSSPDMNESCNETGTGKRICVQKSDSAVGDSLGPETVRARTKKSPVVKLSKIRERREQTAAAVAELRHEESVAQFHAETLSMEIEGYEALKHDRQMTAARDEWLAEHPDYEPPARATAMVTTGEGPPPPPCRYVGLLNRLEKTIKGRQFDKGGVAELRAELKDRERERDRRKWAVGKKGGRSEPVTRRGLTKQDEAALVAEEKQIRRELRMQNGRIESLEAAAEKLNAAASEDDRAKVQAIIDGRERLRTAIIEQEKVQRELNAVNTESQFLQRELKRLDRK